MKKRLPLLLTLAVFCLYTGFYSVTALAQQCLTSGYCSNETNQYPSTTFSTTSSTWTTVSAYMNAGNWTLFKVTAGNTYEWTYCEAYGGVSTNWDAQLTLSNDSTGQFLCFSDNYCGTNGNAPYISWTATYTGIVKLLTSQANCASNTGSPYNTLVWREVNGTVSTQKLGVDVSHYQGTITWPQVKAAPKVFAWAKATQGTTFTDPEFVNNVTNGMAAGVYMGAYHFADAETNTASAEAQHFISVAGSYIKSCELLPVLDLENPSSGPGLTSYFTSSQLTAWVQTWMSTVQQQTGITPVLYTSGSIASYLNSSLNVYPLWIADPDGSSTAQPTNIGVWNKWAFKQYSWTGTVPGISGSGNTDLDVYNGSFGSFDSLLGCTTTGIKPKVVKNHYRIYPNPSHDHITVEKPASENANDASIAIYNIEGQLLLRQDLHQQKTMINVSNFTDGMYFVEIQSTSGVSIKKFVKE